ncbi:MAG: DUF354 domain-containing protein [Asgard group archaeon]|nr:DUF354 domain-containing protein [Asgard group archaeon]
MVNNKIIWFEVLTPKQAMLFLAIGKIFEKLDFSTLYTTRKHDYILDIFDHLGVKPAILGEYGGKTLEGKLLASAKRVVEMSEYIINLERKPIATLASSSPDAARTAFGPGIPLIVFNDTPHSKPVARLTLSLVKYLITPSCIDPNDFVSLGANPHCIHSYKGVDEVEYIIPKYSEIKQSIIEQKDKVLIFRPEESFAAYMKNKDVKPYLEILEKVIASYDGRILVFPRYEAQKQNILEYFEGKIEIPDNGLPFQELLSKAEVLITGGGTMGREAALMGIPSITYFWRHLEPQLFLEQQGFPSFSIQEISNTKKLVEKICKNPSKFSVDTTKMISKLEKPSNVLLKLLKKDKMFQEYFD